MVNLKLLLVEKKNSKRKKKEGKRIYISYLIFQLPTRSSTNGPSPDMLSVGKAVRTTHSGMRAFNYINVMKKSVISMTMI